MGVWNDQLIPGFSNGNCGNPCYLRPSRAGGRSPTRDGRCRLTGSPGGCCPMTCRCRVPLLPHLASATWQRAQSRHAAAAPGRPAPARPSSASGPRKKGAQRLRAQGQTPAGLLLAVAVHPAALETARGGITAWAASLGYALVWADGAWQTGGVPRRWPVGDWNWCSTATHLGPPALGSGTHLRLLNSKDYEALCETTETWIYISMTAWPMASLFLDTL